MTLHAARPGRAATPPPAVDADPAPDGAAMPSTVTLLADAPADRGVSALPRVAAPTLDLAAVAPTPPVPAARLPAGLERPEILDGRLTGFVIEDQGEGVVLARGSFRYVDPDVGDGHRVSVTVLDAPIGGTLEAVIVDGAGEDGIGIVSWTYRIDNDLLQPLAGRGSDTFERFTVTLRDSVGGTVSDTIRIRLRGADDAARIEGNTAATVAEGGGPVGGQLSIVDPDAGESAFEAGRFEARHGSFTLDAGGAWQYALDPDDAQVRALNDGETLVDRLVVHGVGPGRETAELLVTIEGRDDADWIIDAADLGTRGLLLRADGSQVTDGVSLAGGRDLNGDGLADVVIGYGAPGGEDGTPAVSLNAVLYGSAAGSASGVVDLTTLDASQGAQVALSTNPSVYTDVLAGGFDVDGDGLGDLLVADRLSNDVWLVLGQAGGLGADDGLGGRRLQPADVSAEEAVLLRGGGGWPRVLSGAGDANGDGLDDLVIVKDERAFVVFGDREGLGTVRPGGGGVLNLAALQPDQGYEVALPAIRGAVMGISAAGGVGDLNGDGVDEVVFARPSDAPNGVGMGTAYVVWGQAAPREGVLALDQLAPSQGFLLTSARAGANVGQHVTSAGDVNGDGYDDLVLTVAGSNLVDAAHPVERVVLYGRAQGPGSLDASGRAVVDLDRLAPEDGYVLQAPASMRFAVTHDGIGDMNGDGFDDLLVEGIGQAWVVWGRAEAPGRIGADGRQVFDLTTLGPDDGLVIRLDGMQGSFGAGGPAVSAAGDMNGDGFADLLLASRGADDTAGGDTAAMVVFGGPFRTGTTPVVLQGTDGAERLIGAAGADTLSGGGGADVIRAGAGDDRVTIADTAYRSVDGGGGVDTLALGDVPRLLDLRAGVVPGQGELTGFEVIDLRGPAGHQVVLDDAAVLRLGDTADPAFSAARSARAVVVEGDVGDRLTLVASQAAAPGWQQVASASGLDGQPGGAYALYELTDGSRTVASVAVGRDVQVDLQNPLADLSVLDGRFNAQVREDDAALLVDDGRFRFSDLTPDRVYSVTVQPLDGPLIGAMTATVSASSDGLGRVDWHYEVDNGLVQFLGSADVLVERFEFVINDGDGLPLRQVVEARIVGLDEAPPPVGDALLPL